MIFYGSEPMMIETYDDFCSCFGIDEEPEDGFGKETLKVIKEYLDHEEYTEALKPIAHYLRMFKGQCDYAVRSVPGWGRVYVYELYPV